jgi:hypothetical protein
MVRRRLSAGGDQTGWSENKIIGLTALGATGTRPSAPQDERTNPSQIFGATCRKQGKGCGLVPPWRNTEAMILQLAAIAAKVAPGRRAVLLVDQARWHLSARLPVSSKIAILPMPARCTELGPTKTSGNSCETTGPRTARLPVATIWSIIVAKLGRNSLIRPGGPSR